MSLNYEQRLIADTLSPDKPVEKLQELRVLIAEYTSSGKSADEIAEVLSKSTSAVASKADRLIDLVIDAHPEASREALVHALLRTQIFGVLDDE